MTPRTAEAGIVTEPGRAFVLGALLAMAFLLGCFPMADFDVWWHLRTGQLILENGIPRVDLLTYTAAGRPWIDLYWLFQVTIAFLHRLGGVHALVLLKALAGTSLVALSLRSRRPAAPAWPAVVAWVPALVALSGRLCERPELFSLLLLAGFLLILSRAQAQPRKLWLLPVLQMVWVNSHGFFVLGPLVLFAYCSEVAWDRLRATDQPEPPVPTRTLALVAVATLLACLASPYGVHAVGLPFEQFHKLGNSGLYRANIGELRTVGDFIAINGMGNPYLLALVVLFGLGIASFVLQLRRGRLRPFRSILFVAASYLGWQATRNSSLFALVAATVVCWNLDDWIRSAPLPHTAAKSRKRGPARDKGSVKHQRNANALLFAALVLFGISVLSGGLYAWAGEGRTVGLGERKGWYAHDACAFLARPDLPERIVAFNLGQAAVCIAHASPTHKLFIDPRLEVNSQETFERYLSAMRKLWRGEEGWERALGIDYGRPDELPALLIERGVLARAADMLARDSRWRCVFADPVAVAFVPSALAEARGLPAVQR
jgi:hypothetical protein